MEQVTVGNVVGLLNEMVQIGNVIFIVDYRLAAAEAFKLEDGVSGRREEIPLKSPHSAFLALYISLQL